MLTWQLMRHGARVYYEPSAVAFTAAPAGLVHLVRQRARLARGMIEGPPQRQALGSPIAVAGYGQELLGLRRRWK